MLCKEAAECDYCFSAFTLAYPMIREDLSDECELADTSAGFEWFGHGSSVAQRFWYVTPLFCGGDINAPIGA